MYPTHSELLFTVKPLVFILSPLPIQPHLLVLSMCLVEPHWWCYVPGGTLLWSVDNCTTSS